MSRESLILLSLTAVVAAIVAGLAFVVLRLFAAAKQFNRNQQGAGAETAFMAAAMEEAVAKLRSREQAIVARAEASERLSDEIIASLTSGLLVVGEDRRVRSLNPAGRRLLGVPEGEQVRTLSVVAQTAPAVARVVEECIDTGQPIKRRAFKIEPRPDRPTHLGVTVSPIATETGASHGAICLFSDLTDVVELEEQLRIKDSLARVGEMTAGIAHEFRNGLATIHGYGRMLDVERLPGDYRPYIMGIREETESLADVVTKFLNFAKPAELVLTAVDVRAIVERAADDIRQEVIAGGGHLAITGEFGEVPGDEVLLRQAFSNLCRNALEACQERGVTPGIVVHGTRDEAQGVQRVSVRDNGPGIQASVAGTMFRPFVTTKARGIGLGLALVQKIVVTHNGRVAASNSDEGGAKLEVTLPIA